MPAGVVTVGRHRYAVGLYWENSPGRGRVAQIAKEAAEQPGQQADFYVVRPGSKDGRVPQFGLCSGEAGQAPGMPVLAACLATQIMGSWAGAFRLNEGVVVVIVRDDLIVPDGDLFFLEEAEARDRLIQEIGFGGLQTVYAPESWSVPGADSIPLSLLVNDQIDIKLQRVSMPKRVKVIAGLAGGLFVLGLGTLWYFEDKFEQEMLAKERATRQLERAFGQQEMPEPKYIKYWEEAPNVLKVLSSCRDGLSRVPSEISGWKMTTVVCNKGASLTISWRRLSGQTVPPKDSRVDVTGASAVQTIPLTTIPARGPETLKNIDDITNRYLLQNWPGIIGRAAEDPPPPPPPDYNGPWNPPPAPWVKRSFTLNVSQFPGGLQDYIGDLPGTIINNIVYTPGSLSSTSWRVEGVIYENRNKM